MGEVMSMAEIEHEFPSEWVILKDPEVSEAREVLGGEVLCHGKDREEVFRQATELRPGSTAIIYTGPVPDNLVLNV
jgi:hypothetical protein